MKLTSPLPQTFYSKEPIRLPNTVRHNIHQQFLNFKLCLNVYAQALGDKGSHKMVGHMAQLVQLPRIHMQFHNQSTAEGAALRGRRRYIRGCGCQDSEHPELLSTGTFHESTDRLETSALGGTQTAKNANRGFVNNTTPICIK